MTTFYTLGTTQIIRVSGDGRHDFLNRMTTNDLRSPAPGSVIPTLLTTEKGRVVDLIWHLEREDESWLVSSPGKAETIFQRLDQLLFPMDRATLQLGIRPVRLILVIRELANGDVSRWKSIPGGVSWPVTEWFNDGELVLIQDADLAGEVIDEEHLLAETDFQRLRLRQGVPLWGSELNGTYHVQELGLMWAVNFSKGCYPGQEVVARIYNYEKNQRRPALVQWSGTAEPELPAKVVCGDQPGGIITSLVRTDTGYEGFGLLREVLVSEGRDLYLEAAEGLIPIRYKPFSPRHPKGLKNGAGS